MQTRMEKGLIEDRILFSKINTLLQQIRVAILEKWPDQSLSTEALRARSTQSLWDQRTPHMFASSQQASLLGAPRNSDILSKKSSASVIAMDIGVQKWSDQSLPSPLPHMEFPDRGPLMPSCSAHVLTFRSPLPQKVIAQEPVPVQRKPYRNLLTQPLRCLKNNRGQVPRPRGQHCKVSGNKGPLPMKELKRSQLEVWNTMQKGGVQGLQKMKIPKFKVSVQSNLVQNGYATHMFDAILQDPFSKKFLRDYVQFCLFYFAFHFTWDPGVFLGGTSLGVLACFLVCRVMISDPFFFWDPGGFSFLKIGDINFARSLTPQGLADTLCGSPCYMALEIIQIQKYDAKAGLWSVGAILYQLVIGKLPFDGKSQLQFFQNILACIELNFPPKALKELHFDCLDLCKSLLCRNPDERLTFKEFFNHNFPLELRSIRNVDQFQLHQSERSMFHQLVSSASKTISQSHSEYHTESFVDDHVVVSLAANETMMLQIKDCKITACHNNSSTEALKASKSKFTSVIVDNIGSCCIAQNSVWLLISSPPISSVFRAVSLISLEIEPAFENQFFISIVFMPVGITMVSWLALPSSFILFNSGVQKEIKNWQLFLCGGVGVWDGLMIGFVTDYYTSNAYSPVQGVADSCRNGAATNVIFGLTLGYKSVIIPIFAIAISFFMQVSNIRDHVTVCPEKFMATPSRGSSTTQHHIEIPIEELSASLEVVWYNRRIIIANDNVMKPAEQGEHTEVKGEYRYCREEDFVSN